MHPVIWPCRENIIQSDTVYIDRVSYDTIIQKEPVPVEIIKYIEKPVTVYEPIIIPVDTSLIIAEYFSVKYYDDILKDDSTGYIRLKEKVYQSKILDRELFFESRCQDKIITNYISPSGFYYYGSLKASKQIPGVSGGVIYLSKKEALTGFEIGYFGQPYVGFMYGKKF